MSDDAESGEVTEKILERLEASRIGPTQREALRLVMQGWFHGGRRGAVACAQPAPELEPGRDRGKDAARRVRWVLGWFARGRS